MDKFRYVYNLDLFGRTIAILKYPLKFLILAFEPRKFVKTLVGLIGAFPVHNAFKTAKFLNEKETYEYLLLEKKSLIRWGDGDSLIVTNESNSAEKSNSELRSELLKLIVDYKSNESSFLFCIPISPLNDNIVRLFLAGELHVWYRTRYVFNKFLKNYPDFVFGDAHMFKGKANSDHSGLIHLLNNKVIILIHPSKDFFIGLSNILATQSKELFFIKIPQYGAFSEIDSIIYNVDEIVKINGIDVKSLVILITAGSTAKILVKRLSQKYVSYDVGQLSISSLHLSKKW